MPKLTLNLKSESLVLVEPLWEPRKNDWQAGMLPASAESAFPSSSSLVGRHALIAEVSAVPGCETGLTSRHVQRLIVRKCARCISVSSQHKFESDCSERADCKNSTPTHLILTHSLTAQLSTCSSCLSFFKDKSRRWIHHRDDHWSARCC